MNQYDQEQLEKLVKELDRVQRLAFIGVGVAVVVVVLNVLRLFGVLP